MEPVDFKEKNVTYAENQEEYLPLPVYDDGKTVTSCWKLSWRERLKVLFTGIIWHKQMTFGKPLQPVFKTVYKKDVIYDRELFDVLDGGKSEHDENI